MLTFVHAQAKSDFEVALDTACMYLHSGEVNIYFITKDESQENYASVSDKKN